MAIERPQPLLNLADYIALPPEPRGEVFDGVFHVTPAPHLDHQDVVGEIFFAMKSWLHAHPGAGRVFMAPADVVLRPERPAVILQPDVLFVSAARAAIATDRVYGAPDLVVEVVSPASASRDAITKREVYGKYGVQEFWLVSPAERRIDVFVAEAGEGFATSRAYRPEEVITSALMPGFELAIATVFAMPDADG